MRTDDLSLFFKLSGLPASLTEDNIPGNSVPLGNRRLSGENHSAILSSYAAYYERVYFGCEVGYVNWDEETYGPHDLLHFDFTKGGGGFGSDYCDGQKRKAMPMRLAELHNLIALYKRITENDGWKFEIVRPGWDDPYQISKEWICTHGYLSDIYSEFTDIDGIGTALLSLGWVKDLFTDDAKLFYERLSPLAALSGDGIFKWNHKGGDILLYSQCLHDLLMRVWAGHPDNNPDYESQQDGGHLKPCNASYWTVTEYLSTVFEEFYREIATGGSVRLNKRLISTGIGIVNQALGVTKKVIRSYDIRRMLIDANPSPQGLELKEVEAEKEFTYYTSAAGLEIEGISIFNGEVEITLKSPFRLKDLGGYVSETGGYFDDRQVDARGQFAFASVSDLRPRVGGLRVVAESVHHEFGGVPQHLLEGRLKEIIASLPDAEPGYFYVDTKGGRCVGEGIVVDLALYSSWSTDVEFSTAGDASIGLDELTALNIDSTVIASKSMTCRYSKGYVHEPTVSFPGPACYEHGVTDEGSCQYLFAKSVACEKGTDSIGDVEYSGASEGYAEEYAFSVGGDLGSVTREAVLDTRAHAIAKVIGLAGFDFTDDDRIRDRLAIWDYEITERFPGEIDTLYAEATFARHAEWFGHWDGKEITWIETRTDDGTKDGFASPPHFVFTNPNTTISPTGSGSPSVKACRASGRLSMIQQIDFNFKSLHHS